MKRIEEPLRWTDPASDAPGELRSILSDARDALGPSRAELTHLEALVTGAIGVGSAPAAAEKTAALKGGLTKVAALKLAGALAVCGAGAGVAVAVHHHEPPPPSVEAPLVAPGPATPATPSPQAPEPTPAPAAPAADVAAAPPSVPAPTPSAPGPAPAPAPDRPTSAPIEPPHPPPSTPSPTTPAAPAFGAPAEPAPADPAPPSLAPAPEPESELGLLGRARAEMASDPAAALRALEAHRTAYEHGAFAQEREVLAIEALVRLGRKSDAEARAAGFARAFPGSAHWRRILVLLGEDGGT